MQKYKLFCWARLLEYKGEDFKDEEVIEGIKKVIEKSREVRVIRNMKFFKEIEKYETTIRNPEDFVNLVKHTQRIGITYVVNWSVLLDRDVKSLEEAIKWARDVFSVRARYSEVNFQFRTPDNKLVIILSNSFADFSRLKIEKTHNSNLFLTFDLLGFERLWEDMPDSFIEDYVQELIEDFLQKAGSIAEPLLKDKEYISFLIFHDRRGAMVYWPDSRIIRGSIIKEGRQIGQDIEDALNKLLSETNILDTNYFLQRKTLEHLPSFGL